MEAGTRNQVVHRVRGDRAIEIIGDCAHCQAALGSKGTTFLALQADNSIVLAPRSIVLCYNCGGESVFLCHDVPLKAATQADINYLLDRAEVDLWLLNKYRNVVKRNASLRRASTAALKDLEEIVKEFSEGPQYNT